MKAILFDTDGVMDLSNEDMKSLIENVRNKGIKCYMVTNQPSSSPLFDGIFCSAELGVKKPSQEFYKKVFAVISKENIEKEDVLYVDDSETNVLAGIEFGFSPLHYSSFEEFKEELDLMIASNSQKSY